MIGRRLRAGGDRSEKTVRFGSRDRKRRRVFAFEVICQRSELTPIRGFDL
jgi:hypothetical protein